ncbi:MAG: hypothetical protein ISS45_05490 [Candidatus Omnitrophica bacterium]|nr:hypothetical protein [Candidatus Omnitrophota bacterium]
MYYKNPNYHYVSNIPQRLHEKSGIIKHNFLVFDTFPRPPARYIQTKDGKLEEICNAAYCAIKKKGGKLHVIIEKDKFRVLYDSIISLGQIAPFTPYANRYMNLYKSLESLTSNIDFEFRAIRHGLSHSPHALSNKKTVETLKKLFGTKYIDLSKGRHLRIFYLYFAKMLIEHDKILYNEIIRRLKFLKTAKRIIKIKPHTISRPEEKSIPIVFPNTPLRSPKSPPIRYLV